MAAFKIEQFFRLPTSKIFRSPPVEVLTKSPCYISGNPGIKGVVGTEYNIYEPGHCLSSPEGVFTKKLPVRV